MLLCNVSQAFDKVWHDGMLFKIIFKTTFTKKFHCMFKNYLSESHFFVKQHDVIKDNRYYRLYNC